MRRGLASPDENKMNFVGKVCCNSCKALLAALQRICKTRQAPKAVDNTSVYHSGCHDKHNCPRCVLGPVTPQSDARTTRPL